jgi:hypothetical protein
MTKLFRPDLDNRHYPVLQNNGHEDALKFGKLNFERLSHVWKTPHFEFYTNGKSSGLRPDISVVMPGIAFRSDLRELLFPESPPEIEFLPIFVSGEAWLLMNCLCAISDYDEGKSILHRAGQGEIFLVQKLAILGRTLRCKFFTVDGSNRAYIYVTEPFVNRVRELGLKGLNFKLIGNTVA